MNARKALVSIVAAVGMAAVSAAWAQAPAGSTGQCKDNTYTKATSKRGACHGHGGVKEWYAAEQSEPKKTSKSSKAKAEAPATTAAAPAAMPAEKPATTKSTASARGTAAPGGGAGKVWVNTATNVYHCQGTRWYGKTKQGEYMSESEAKAKGAHADHGKACG